MKKALLPLVIAAAALPLSAVADVTVYGKANVSLQNADENDESAIELVSNASRIGLKGSEEINSSLKAIYQFEYQTEVDDGASGATNTGPTITQRNIYVGLQGTGGTIMGGKFDTPVKVLQEKIDLFNDLEGDMAYLLDGETRANNIVQYTTPLFGAFAVNIAHVSSEVPDVDDGKSVSLTYTTPAFYFGLAAEQDVSAVGRDISRVAVRWTVSALQLGALFEHAEDDTDTHETDGWLVSAKINATDKLAFKGQYGTAAADDVNTAVTPAANLEIDDTQLNIGVDYLLSKNTTVFGYYTKETRETNSVEAPDGSWVGVGLELKF